MRTDARERWDRGISLGLALGVQALLFGSGVLWQPGQKTTADTALALVRVELQPPTPALPLPPVEPPSRKPPTPTPPIPQPAPLPLPLAQAVIEHVPFIQDDAMPDPSPGEPQAPADPVPSQATTALAPPAGQHTARPHAITAWQQQLLAHLQRYRRYPGAAKRLRQEGNTHVRFSVDRQGRISQPRIESASGHRLLDEEALATVHRANPVPPPPPEVAGNPVDVVVPVGFHLRRR